MCSSVPQSITSLSTVVGLRLDHQISPTSHQQWSAPTSGTSSRNDSGPTSRLACHLRCTRIGISPEPHAAAAPGIEAAARLNAASSPNAASSSPATSRPRSAPARRRSSPSRIGGFGSRASVLGGDLGPFHGEQVASRRSNHGWWSSVLARGSERARGRAGEIATVLVVLS
jgi:hypothetical protein